MDVNFLVAGAAWLPDPLVVRWAWPLSWALVLAAAFVALTARLPALLRWSGAAGLAAWAVLPGTISPAHWLGLAFQSPSVLSTVLCSWFLTRQVLGGIQPAARRGGHPIPEGEGINPQPLAWPAWALGVLLGWVLLLDMLAFWPVSIYAWGFSPLALWLVCGLTAGLWLFTSQRPGGQPVSAALAATLLLFVLTRAPTGNLWDALLDPWLWVGLQVLLLRRSSFVGRVSTRLAALFSAGGVRLKPDLRG